MPDPIYTADNCREPAYQLNWSYSLFWHAAPPEAAWLEPLQKATEADGIRILQHEFADQSVSQFLVSTRPDVAPQFIAQRLKGRLQILVRETTPSAFKRNYSIRSVGSANRATIDEYLQSQLDHHPCADERVTEQLQRLQIHNADVDLSQPSHTSHAIYWYNLHLVLVNDGRYREVHDEPLQALHDMIVRASRAKSHDLSRAAILPDHIHLALRCGIEESPESVALSYLNNLAFASGMKRVFRLGYYVGTFGEYDLGVISRKGLAHH
jgi:REP element-mobilizing transposase RayT